MDDQQTQSERERFEAWVNKGGSSLNIHRHGASEIGAGHYSCARVQLAWESWQAARHGAKKSDGVEINTHQVLQIGGAPICIESNMKADDFRKLANEQARVFVLDGVECEQAVGDTIRVAITLNPGNGCVTSVRKKPDPEPAEEGGDGPVWEQDEPGRLYSEWRGFILQVEREPDGWWWGVCRVADDFPADPVSVEPDGADRAKTDSEARAAAESAAREYLRQKGKGDV